MFRPSKLSTGKGRIQYNTIQYNTVLQEGNESSFFTEISSITNFLFYFMINKVIQNFNNMAPKLGNL